MRDRQRILGTWTSCTWEATTSLLEKAQAIRRLTRLR